MPQDLTEALLAAGVPQLLPKVIDPMMLEYQRRFAPLVRAIPAGKYGTDIFTFNRRTLNPSGGFVQDGGARPQSQSKYEQFQFQMKHLEVTGSVTGYTELVTKDVIQSLRQSEIEGSIQGLLWDLETAIGWGNAAATQYGAYPQFDGFDSLVSNYSGSEQNAIDFADGSLSLGVLDRLLDMVQTNTAANVFTSDYMLVMSPTANSRLGQLLISQQRFVDQVEIAPGLIVPTYRNVPIVPSSFMSARTNQMSTVTTAAGTTGGTLATATYYYKVSAVIARQGEIQCAAEVSQAVTGPTGTVTLSFTPPAGYENGAPMLYKVYRATSTGAETLIGIVDATVGLNADGITPILTTSIVDDGAKLTPKNGSTVPVDGPATYVGANTAKKPAAAGSENIYLVARNKDYLYRPYVRDITPLNITTGITNPDSLPYALITDTTLALRAPKFIGQVTRVASALSA